MSTLLEGGGDCFSLKCHYVYIVNSNSKMRGSKGYIDIEMKDKKFQKLLLKNLNKNSLWFLHLCCNVLMAVNVSLVTISTCFCLFGFRLLTVISMLPLWSLNTSRDKVHYLDVKLLSRFRTDGWGQLHDA